MGCHSIRRLTAAERKARDTQAVERYAELHAIFEAEQLHEYNENFGPTYQAKHPFKLNTERLHEQVCRRIREENAAFEESRAENER